MKLHILGWLSLKPFKVVLNSLFRLEHVATFSYFCCETNMGWSVTIMRMRMICFPPKDLYFYMCMLYILNF